MNIYPLLPGFILLDGHLVLWKHLKASFGISTSEVSYFIRKFTSSDKITDLPLPSAIIQGIWHLFGGKKPNQRPRFPLSLSP